MSDWSDPRVRRGMQRQLEQRNRLIADGARAVGWKAGFGTRQAMEAIGTTAPITAFMTDRSLVPDGGEASITGWKAPMVEVEIAVRLGSDLPGGSDRAAVERAVGALAPAIELVDLDGPRGPEDLEDVIASGIFHRGLVLGELVDRASVSLDEVRLTVDRTAGRHAEGVDPTVATGDPLEVVRAIADLLEDAGERLRAGEIVIAGAAIPPFAAEAGETVTARFDGLGAVSVALR
mgnify:CR=1 FL=1|jgi:2-oxo-3-hexenedioate decarboxylase